MFLINPPYTLKPLLAAALPQMAEVSAKTGRPLFPWTAADKGDIIPLAGCDLAHRIGLGRALCRCRQDVGRASPVPPQRYVSLSTICSATCLMPSPSRQITGGGPAQVDDAARRVGAAVVDADQHFPPVTRLRTHTAS